MWYIPFGDDSDFHVTETMTWAELAAVGVCKVADFDEEKVLIGPARADFEYSLRALGPVPTYNDVDGPESLHRAFDYGIKVDAPAMHGFRWILIEDELRSADGVHRFVTNVDGTSSLSGEERQLDWERAASYVARASVSHGQGADYVGDPFEHPIAALTIRSRRESPTAQLYSRLVTSFEGKLAGLKDDGYPMALANPPVPAVVLDRSDGSLRSVIQETVALRAEFAPSVRNIRGMSKPCAIRRRGRSRSSSTSGGRRYPKSARRLIRSGDSAPTRPLFRG